MTATDKAPVASRPVVVAGLRRWAQGAVTDEAAVELLIRCLAPSYTRPSSAWLRPCRRAGWFWLDASQLQPFVVLHLGNHNVSMHVFDVATLTALAQTVAEARNLLAAALAGQDRLPVDTLLPVETLVSV